MPLSYASLSRGGHLLTHGGSNRVHLGGHLLTLNYLI